MRCVPLLVACILLSFDVEAQSKPTPPQAPSEAKPDPKTEAAQASKLPVVRFIATGGTIAMKIDPVKRAPVPAISGEDLIATVPEIEKVARIEVQNLSNVPSDYMDPDRWVQLQRSVSEALARPEVAGVIVSHGTDTLEETAWFLDLTVDSDKPVVLMGAQRNASERDFDGPRNLLNAARICIDAGARGKGAMIALNDNINAARDAVKTQTSDVDTFKSGDLGYLGYVDHDRVAWYRAPLRRQHIAIEQETDPGSVLKPREDASRRLGASYETNLLGYGIERTRKHSLWLARYPRQPCVAGGTS